MGIYHSPSPWCGQWLECVRLWPLNWSGLLWEESRGHHDIHGTSEHCRGLGLCGAGPFRLALNLSQTRHRREQHRSFQSSERQVIDWDAGRKSLLLKYSWDLWCNYHNIRCWNKAGQIFLETYQSIARWYSDLLKWLFPFFFQAPAEVLLSVNSNLQDSGTRSSWAGR